MNNPTIYSPEQVIESASHCQVGLPDGQWVAARAMGWQGICLRYRIKCAWMVFTGSADVLRWTGQEKP